MNRYEEKDNYMIGYTQKGHQFYFDKEDYELVKQYNWVVSGNDEDIITKQDGKRLTLHKLIMGDGIYTHLNRLHYDNRKENLAPVRGMLNPGVFDLNGYNALYMPEHPKSFKSNGCVYEHILIAEEMLGRPLSNKECVHHIDRNRKNNSKDNLIVFRSNSDHSRFHKDGIAIKQSDGTYISTYRNTKYTQSHIAKSNMQEKQGKQHKTRPTKMPNKETLENDIFSMPMIQVGKKYGVSDVAVRKWCKKCGLPYTRKDIKNYKSKLGKKI